MIAPKTLGEQVRTINIFGALKPGASVSLYQYDPRAMNMLFILWIGELKTGNGMIKCTLSPFIVMR
nr:hypothetical protein [Galbibacter sp. EGI 63066]